MRKQWILVVSCLWLVVAPVRAEPVVVPASEEETAPIVDMPALRSAAEKGDAAAQVKLGTLYIEGSGVKADEAEAAIWFRRAADTGNAVAQFNLGLLFIRGAGVPQNDVEAYKWLTVAAERGYKGALSPRDSVAGRMKPEQLDQAREQARAWKPSAKLPEKPAEKPARKVE